MDNIALVRALHDMWNTGNLDMYDQIFSPDFVAHWPASSHTPTRRGIEGLRYGVERVRTAFPDWHELVVDMFGSGDRVASRYVSTGTHLGAFGSLQPTGKRVKIDEISIIRCADGRIVEQWCLFDEVARLQQLGAAVS
jgi:predicted ester cyclase